MKPLAIALALVLASPAAHADPAFVEEGPPPEPLTKLGWRFGVAQIPLAANALGGAGLAIGVDHEVWRALRVIAEYEWLWLSAIPYNHRVTLVPFVGMGHRTHLGLRRALATKRFEGLRVYLDGEVGGGLGIYDAPSDVEVLPHGFVGLRAGWQLTKRRARASRTFEIEVQVRTLVVEHGLGVGGGMGFWWGD